MTQKKQRLHEIIKTKSFKTGDFILASGARSNYLFDLKTTLLDPEGANLAADLLLEKIDADVTALGGLELGACPIVSAVCVKSFLVSKPIKTFYVRKEKKGRGSNNLIEGNDLLPSDKVIVVDDVTTKAGSVIEAIKVVEASGAKVVKVLSVLDRLEGARENLAAINVDLDSIFVRTDFI